jgi:hypothetical protein
MIRGALGLEKSMEKRQSTISQTTEGNNNNVKEA